MSLIFTIILVAAGLGCLGVGWLLIRNTGNNKPSIGVSLLAVNIILTGICLLLVTPTPFAITLATEGNLWAAVVAIPVIIGIICTFWVFG